mmetsp:Transcript_61410/g.126810  ORF Transcript_61410/g.126810 Transcript_61410/m.126810 type:complete len:106 (+) Transcript_61410:480-797(+)
MCGCKQGSGVCGLQHGTQGRGGSVSGETDWEMEGAAEQRSRGAQRLGPFLQDGRARDIKADGFTILGNGRDANRYIGATAGSATVPLHIGRDSSRTRSGKGHKVH